MTSRADQDGRVPVLPGGARGAQPARQTASSLRRRPQPRSRRTAVTPSSSSVRRRRPQSAARRSRARRFGRPGVELRLVSSSRRPRPRARLGARSGSSVASSSGAGSRASGSRSVAGLDLAGGRLGLEQDVVGHRAQVGVEVAAQHVAQQRAHVGLQLGRSARGLADALRGSRAAAHQARSSSSAARCGAAGPPLALLGAQRRQPQRQAVAVLVAAAPAAPAGGRTAPRPPPAREQPMSKRPTAQATWAPAGRVARRLEEAGQVRPRRRAVSASGSPRAAPGALELQRLPAALGLAARTRCPGATAPGAERRSASTRPRKRSRGLGDRQLVAVGISSSSTHDAPRRRLAVLGPGGLGRGAAASPVLDRQAAAQLEQSASSATPRRAATTSPARRPARASARPRHHALEALLGEAEVGGVLVQALEHRPQRGLGLLAAQAVRAQPAARRPRPAPGRPGGRRAAAAAAASAGR